MRSSSSTAPTSPIASPAGCARRCPICRSSTMSARASGRGGRAGPRKCSPTSIACSASCRSSPRPIVRLGGPRCVYVGHPLIERLGELRPNPDEARRRNAEPPVLVVLPGSRRSEIRRLMADFGGALGLLAGGDRAVRGDPADAAPYRGGGARPRRAVAGRAEDRARRGGETRGVPHRARGARRLRHGDARACARRRAAGRRLQGGEGRGAAQIPDQGPLDPAAEPDPRPTGRFPRSCSATATRRRSPPSWRRSMRDGPERARPARRLWRGSTRRCASPTATLRAPTRRGRCMQTIGARRMPPDPGRRLSASQIADREAGFDRCTLSD